MAISCMVCTICDVFLQVLQYLLHAFAISIARLCNKLAERRNELACCLQDVCMICNICFPKVLVLLP